jgi:hypothetical protein
MSFRITVRGEGVELRGQISDWDRVSEIAEALEPTGVMVISSPYESISETQLREMARRIADEHRSPREHDGLDDDLAEQHARLERKAGLE